MDKTNEQEITGNIRELTMTDPEEMRCRDSGSLSSNESSDFQTHDGIILSEARGQIRISVPHSEFRDRFLSRLQRDVTPRGTHIQLFKSLDGRKAPQAWEEKTFHEDVLEASKEIMCQDLNPDLKFRYDSSQPLASHPRPSPTF